MSDSSSALADRLGEWLALDAKLDAKTAEAIELLAASIRRLDDELAEVRDELHAYGTKVETLARAAGADTALGSRRADQ